MRERLILSRLCPRRGALKASAKGTIIRDKDTIFATELSKFDEIINFLKESVGEKQEELMEQIVDTNQAYRKSRDVSEATSKREQVLQNIQIALVESEGNFGTSSRGTSILSESEREDSCLGSTSIGFSLET